MLTFEEMILRLGVAIFLGVIVGLERETAGKEAGIRTDMMVAVGAALFSIAALSLPYIISPSAENVPDVIARNGGFLAIIANIVVGIGFLGAGIIVKQGVHVRGLTTAATVWFVAALGILAGIGLIKLALVVGIALTLILWVLRKISLVDRLAGKTSGDN